MIIKQLVQKYISDTQGMTFGEQLDIVTSYIKEKKNIDVRLNFSSIRTKMDQILFHVAFCTAFDYFIQKYEITEAFAD